MQMQNNPGVSVFVGIELLAKMEKDTWREKALERHRQSQSVFGDSKRRKLDVVDSYSGLGFEREQLSWQKLMMVNKGKGNEERETCLALQYQNKEKLHQEALEMMSNINMEDDDGDEMRKVIEIYGLEKVVEIFAHQNGLIFEPIPVRKHGGHQVYGFGNVSIILDKFNQNQKVFAQTQEDRWSLVCLPQLLHLHLHLQKQ